MPPMRTMTSACACCGVTFQQPDDPGRRREYCTNACRQRAYRQRGGRASGTRTESARQRQRREEQEAWAREEARRERERQRSRARRGAPREHTAAPEWTYPRPGDDAGTTRRRRTCHLLYVRARHASTPEAEAKACAAKAEQMRQRYGL